MANRTKVTQQKRARERAKQERQQEKTRRRKSRKTPSARSDNGEDPDIAGIIPGPQPSPWGDELLTSEPEEE